MKPSTHKIHYSPLTTSPFIVLKPEASRNNIIIPTKLTTLAKALSESDPLINKKT